ncbi:carboxylesterase family protein [Durotheca rogersii]|uniref:carboxylesterase family protein n=1 Tax=Durotheca rogersii TaxID=419775 RepID=UPI00221EBF80|nr:carboxylesterase family protein [Durotheca rogersii]KAI5865119.1 carboxylesterase family protein [Durotheca rogersii]
MRPLSLFGTLALCGGGAVGAAISDGPLAVDLSGVTYRGLRRNGIEVFLGIPYGQDTSGPNRFKPPRPFVPVPGSTFDARSYGPPCIQSLGEGIPPLTLSNTTEVSEDCLNLNVARPRGLPSGKNRPLLPVMVFIYGGSFVAGQTQELSTAPDGLILESVENGLPIIHVGMNYRVGVFGFAQSDALEAEGSENAGLRDQRLALEWVRDNIKQFGGDPERVTIFGQSSGGLAVTMQILAYGGARPAPFRQVIVESTALEPGITGTFSADAFRAIVEDVGCGGTSNSTGASPETADVNSPETVACLRALDVSALQAAAENTAVGDIAHNNGDIWLPAVDGDFLPAAPSQLLTEGRFSRGVTSAMLGWCEDDLALGAPEDATTPEDVRAFVRAYLPGLSASALDALLALYPSDSFPQPPADAANGIASEFRRAARIYRDVLMTCGAVRLGAALAGDGAAAYLYSWNQTILDSMLAELYGLRGLGVVHTSEFAYIFGNLSRYDIPGWGFAASPSDYALASRASRSWSTFASVGAPGLPGRDTFAGFAPAFPIAAAAEGEAKEAGGEQKWLGDYFLFVAGGPFEGLSAVEGPAAEPAVAAQKLRERCAFLNSYEIVQQLRY